MIQLVVDLIFEFFEIDEMHIHNSNVKIIMNFFRQTRSTNFYEFCNEFCESAIENIYRILNYIETQNQIKFRNLQKFDIVKIVIEYRCGKSYELFHTLSRQFFFLQSIY